MSENVADPKQIETELGRTRARMDARLTELQGRLSPGQIVDDLMGYFRGNEGGDFARNLMESVRSNPMPAALTGIGLAWLMASNPKKNVSGTTTPVLDGDRQVQGSSASSRPAWATHDEFDRHLLTAEHEVTRHDEEAEPDYRGRLDIARGRVLGVARQSEDTQESFGDRVKDAIAATRQSITQSAYDLQSRASDATSQAGGIVNNVGHQLGQSGQTAQQMGSNLLTTITDNPVLLGAVGLAVGALLGAFVPQSKQEEDALGNVAGQARNAARDLAQTVVDRGGEVAQKKLDAGRESARAHGLTTDKSAGSFVDEALSGDLTGNVKQVAQDLLKARDAAIHQAGLDHAPDPVEDAPASRPQEAAAGGARIGTNTPSQS
jgi:Protein of unknown function (DUF3618)